LPCDVSDLERGAVCLALYPYTTSFPLEKVVRAAEGELLTQIERISAIEDLESTIAPGDAPSEIVARFKLRRVLVLHDGTRAGIQDVAVARVNSVTPEKQARERWWARVSNGTHPLHLLIGAEARHGTNGKPAYVDATSIGFIPKSTVLRRVGMLDASEMGDVSRRIITALELDT
jgi:hypothetical protein